MPLVPIESSRLRLEVLPEAGASIVNLAVRRGDSWLAVLRPTPREAIAAGNSSLMACFALVPYSNRLRDARFTFRGRTYQLWPNTADGHAIHGDVRKRPWTLETRSAERLTFSFDSRRFADVNFPFPFTARMTYRLDESSLVTELSVTNAGAAAFPAGLGFHPYFRRTLLDGGEKVELEMRVGGIYRELIPPGAATPLGPDEDFSTARPIGGLELDNCFAGWDGRAQLRWPGSRVRAEIEASDALRHVILYTPRGAPYFALEPVSNANDGFNLLEHGVPDSGVRVLEPGEVLEARFRLRLSQE